MIFRGYRRDNESLIVILSFNGSKTTENVYKNPHKETEKNGATQIRILITAQKSILLNTKTQVTSIFVLCGFLILGNTCTSKNLFVSLTSHH